MPERAACFETVFVLVYRCLRAGDGTTFKVGVALHVDGETAVSSLDAALLTHARVVAVDVGLAYVHVATDQTRLGYTHHHGTTYLAALLAISALVLQALDVQVAAHIRRHLLALYRRPFERRVCAALDAHAVRPCHMRVGVAHVCAVAAASAFARAARVAQACTSVTQLHRYTHARACVAAAARLAGCVLCGKQVDLVVRLQAHRLAAHIAALHGEVFMGIGIWHHNLQEIEDHQPAYSPYFAYMHQPCPANGDMQQPH